MYTQLRTELNTLKDQFDLLKNLLSNYDSQKGIDKIQVGSRVRIKHENGKSQEGRVTKFSQNLKQWLINRDGYAGTIGIPNERIELVYIGIENIIDIKLWEIRIRINELEEILKESDLPEYLKDKTYVNVLVVGTKTIDYFHHFIDFQIYNYIPVLRIKVLSENYRIGDYYQLQIKDGILEDIRPISKERYYNAE